MNSALTPISDRDHKLDIIDHVNQDHPKELLAIAQAQIGSEAITSVRLIDIFQQGIQIKICPSNENRTRDAFVPFEIEGSLEDKILYLTYASIAKQKTNFEANGKCFFEVTDKSCVTQNIIRITIKSALPLPDDYAGHAYALVLKTLNKKPTSAKQYNVKKQWLKRILDRFFIWLLKNLSKKNRDKLLYKTNKKVRLYTLRKAWKSTDTAPFNDRGIIDIYTHNNTLGSEWVRQLKPGDIFMSRSQTKDRHPHLAKGNALIIADETAFPAAAGIIENWQNPIPPVLITISSKPEEQEYFTNEQLPSGTEIHRVICAESEQADRVLNIIKNMVQINAVWAALESASAKTIRHYLRNERGLSGKNNHTKAYWSIKASQQD